MKKVRYASFSPVLIALFLLSACATTTTTNIWRDQTYQGPVKKILIMGISKKQGVQRFFEDEFFRQLRGRGTDAVAGYSILPYDEKMDKDFIAAKAREIGADAVLVTRPLGRKTERAYMPGSPYYRPGGYYGYAYSPGYIVEDEYVFLETNLFDVATEKLIWSAESETVILASDQELIKEFIRTMIAKLAADRLIK
jgi:hypothetical protein